MSSVRSGPSRPDKDESSREVIFPARSVFEAMLVGIEWARVAPLALPCGGRY